MIPFGEFRVLNEHFPRNIQQQKILCRQHKQEGKLEYIKFDKRRGENFDL